MVSKRGKRKRSSGEQGEQKRKRASGETSVDSTSTGDEVPAEQADTCEETSCADSQEVSDSEQNAAVDSTENNSTLVSSQPFASQPSGSQPSAQADKISDESKLCKDGGDAPTSTKEEAVTSTLVQDSDCHSSVTLDTNTEVSPQKSEREGTDQCDEESDTTLTNEGVECNTSAEPVKEEEQPTEEEAEKDKQLEESSQKMKETSAEKTDDKVENSSNQETDEAQEAPLKNPECLSLSSTHITDPTEHSVKTVDEAHQEISRDDENRNEDEMGTDQESAVQSSTNKDNQYQTDMSINEEAVKEKESIEEETENAQNDTKENAMENACESNEAEMNVVSTADTKNEQTMPTKTLIPDALLTKPAEHDQLLRELVNKTQLAQPNQAGDFLDMHALDKPIISESGLEKEKDKKADTQYETDTYELQKKEKLQLEGMHVNLADKDRRDNIAAIGKEFVEPFDLSNSQAFPDDGNAFEMDVTESQLCAVSDDILSEGENGDDESRRQQQQQQQDGERLIQSVLNSLLSLNEQISRARQQMQAERRKLQNTRLPPTKAVRQTFHR